MQTSVYRMGRTISWSDTKKIFIGQILLEMYIFTFLFLFFSDVTPFPPRALCVYASIPLAFLGIMNFPKATPSLRFFCVTFAFSWAYQQVRMGEVGFKPLLVTFATFFIVIYYQQMGKDGLERLKNFIALLFIASFVMFIMTILSNTAFALRCLFYSGIEYKDIYTTKRLYLDKGGFAPSTFEFGYQVAAGMGLFIAEVYKSSTRKSIFYLCLVVFSALTLILCGERSPLLALAAVFLVLTYIVGSPKKVALLSLALIFAYFPLKQAIDDVFELKPKASLTYRMADEGLRSEAFDRLRLQLAALTLIPLHPFGIREREDYYTAMMLKSGVEKPTSPHNGYITQTLFYGWFLLFIAIIVLHKLLNMARVIKRKRLYESLPVVGGLVGALVNACFHNDSFLSFSSETVILLMLLGGYFDFNIAKGSKYSRRR